MPELTIEEFFHDFRQGIMASAETNTDFLEVEFARSVASELSEAGIIEDFVACHYRPALGGMRVDGYWLNDNSLELFIVDCPNSEKLQSLTQTEVGQIFKRLENFFVASATKNLYTGLEETSQGYDLARLIAESKDNYTKVNLYLFSEKNLSVRLTELPDKVVKSWTLSYHVWDISRLHRLASSQGAREEIVIDFTEYTKGGLPCLPAHLNNATYQSFLVVIPATILASLYEKYGARLLEQNVRTFLQLRGNINKGIRATIIHDPEMFFAYNNGITATAREIDTFQTANGVAIKALRDLQIVNGGQTTASLFHTRYKDKASLDKIFVQMKLSVIDVDKSEEIVPKISEYANTQNKVNAADFFSNHPYHVRMQEFSRRLWAPARQGSQRETKWFYERARGQYADAQSKLSKSERNRFLAEFPKDQMFTKTDLAKYENVWDDKPTYVNLGAQKNFAHYARRIGAEWEKTPDRFNELYYKRMVARAVLFKRTEKLISAQPWYDGGYRANTVAYTIAMIAHICRKHGQAFDFLKIWNRQDITDTTIKSIEIVARHVREIIMRPPGNATNIGEWCKTDPCWLRIQDRMGDIISELPDQFFNELLNPEDVRDTAIDAAKTQKIYNGIEAQNAVYQISTGDWANILSEGNKRKLYTPTEVGVLQVAMQMPTKIPSEKQALLLLKILEKARVEAIYHD